MRITHDRAGRLKNQQFHWPSWVLNNGISIGDNAMKLTQARLKELLDYDQEAGIFTKKKARPGPGKVGSEAGCKMKNGYKAIRVDGVLYFAHRLVFLWVEGYIPENSVDHINRDTSDNRRPNLREISHQCNLRNCNLRGKNSSGITGVGLERKNKKWRAQICISYKRILLGVFKTKLEAAQARWEAEVKYNFPNCNTTSSAYNYIKASRAA